MIVELKSINGDKKDEIDKIQHLSLKKSNKLCTSTSDSYQAFL